MNAAFVAGLALLATVHLSPVCANDVGPDVFVKNDRVKIYMFMGDTLRASGALAADCVREARDWARTIEARESALSDAPPAIVPVFSRRYDIMSITGNKRYVSVIRRGRSETGGVETGSEDAAFLWDTKLGMRIGFGSFFKETADGGSLATRLYVEVTGELFAKIGRDQATPALAALAPSLKELGAISLSPSTIAGKTSGLTFHFAIALSGHPTLQHLEIFVPWTGFERHLSPHGRALFGGRRRERYIW